MTLRNDHILLEVTFSFSNSIIKKGDHFSIYLNITNGHEGPITVTEVKLIQPMGFIPVRSNEQSLTLLDAFRNFMKYDNFSGPPPPKGQVDETLIGPSMIHKPNQTIQPKGEFREDFNLKAGWTGGLRPRPDTYKISAEVIYEVEDTKSQKRITLHKPITIKISIFPSLSSMLFGALFGSVLGTIVRGFLSSNGQGLELSKIIPSLFINLVLGFVIAVTLMRKKDVQPFLTIEDFWGGILLGFLVGTNGQVFLDVLKNLSTQEGTNI